MGDYSSKIKVTTSKDGKDYVFISYRSKNRETMEKIVYELQSRYGLRVYYDKNFGVNNPNWTTQFPENMDSDRCRAIIIFISNDYYTSYATLMELLHSQCGEAEIEGQPMSVIPITIEDIHSVEGDGDENTGLGVHIFPTEFQNNINPHWKNEVRLFVDSFEEIRDEFEEIKKYGKPLENAYIRVKEASWRPCDYKRPVLKKKNCRKIFDILISKVDVHDSRYDEKDDAFLKRFAEKIRNTKGVGDRVFGEPAKKADEPPVKAEEHAEIRKPEPPAAAPKPLEPSAPPAPPAPLAEGELLYEIKSGEVNARFTQKTDEYGKAIYILHSGSRIARTVAVSAPDGAKRKRQELEAAGMLVDSVVHTEVEFGSSSALGCFCRGSSESGTRFVKASRLISNDHTETVSDTVKVTEAPTDTSSLVADTVKTEPPRFENNKDGEYYETTKAGVNARYKIIAAENRKTFILLSGSRINPSVANSAPAGVTRRREELAAEGKLVDFTVAEDVEFTSASALASFCVGGSKSGTEFIEKDSRLISGITAADCNNASGSSAETENVYSSGVIGENRLIKQGE